MKKNREDNTKNFIKKYREKLDDKLYEEVTEHLSSTSFSYTPKYFPARVFYDKGHRTELEHLMGSIGVYRNIRWGSENFVETDLDARQMSFLVKRDYVFKISNQKKRGQKR